MTYRFWYTENGVTTTFRNLTKRKAIMMYNIYHRDLAIKNYDKIGWSVEE